MSSQTPLLEELVKASEVPTDVRSYRESEEFGDAEFFASMVRSYFVYDHAARAWYKYVKNHWAEDLSGEVSLEASKKLAAVYLRSAADAQERGDEKAAKDNINRARALQRRKRIENVLWFAKSMNGIALKGDEWDRDPMILAVSNGVIDLKTGTFRDGQPGEYIRVHSPVEWLGINEPAPHWEQFIHEVFAENEEVVKFVQRLFGYCLTGNTSEHRLPILYGEGRNGKTTLLQALANVFGSDLSHSTQADMLMNVKRDGAGPQPFVYALRGRRLVWATESREGQRINAGLIKQLTGGDSITTRTLFQATPVTFKPSHKVMLLTNHKPHISAEDQAMWDRVLLIPFELRFVDDPKGSKEYKRNARLPEVLEAESSGILAWLVRGCLAWQAEGLCPPAKVIAATEAYREDEDTLGEFIADCLIVGEGKQASATSIYERYKTWAQENELEKMSQKWVSQRLIRRFGEPSRNSHGKFYNGIGLLVHDV